MRGFFSLDGAFYKWGSLVADVMILSFMWILFSIPIVTIGASTSALFYVTTRRISEREGYITRDFWEAFKSNFKKATGVWLLHMLIVIILYLNIMNIHVVGDMATVLYPLQIVVFIEITFVSFYLYPLIARFEMGWKQLIKSAFFMANRHMLTTLMCAVLAAAVVLGIFLYPLLFFVAMGLYAWLSSYLLMRVFKKYRPEMDKNPVLELQELERELEEKKRREELNGPETGGPILKEGTADEITVGSDMNASGQERPQE